MGLAYIVVAVLSAAVAVFALQNTQPTSLRFLVWSIDSMPLAGAVLVSLAAGLVLAAVPLSIVNWRRRSRIRALEARVSMLETSLATRDAPRSPRVPARPRLSRRRVASEDLAGVRRAAAGREAPGAL